MKICPICETDDEALIRNCELRGMFNDCASTHLPYVDRHAMKPRAPKEEKRAK